MRFEKRFTDYMTALRFRNKIMFNKLARNPRLKRHGNGWAVTYENNKFIV